MTDRKYRWQMDRLAALSVVLGNLVVFTYLAMRLMTDDYFFGNQIGWRINLSPWQRLSGLALSFGLLVLLNTGFLKREPGSRAVLALMETLVLVIILKNVFIYFLYRAGGWQALSIHWIALILQSYVLYHTLFSKQILTYFGIIKKES